MIKLDLFRLLGKSITEVTIDEPDSDCRYTPYKIFIIETRLYPLIYDMFPNENITIYTTSIYNPEKNRMDVYLKIVKLDKIIIEKQDDPIILTQEQRNIIESKLNEINSVDIHYALIDINRLYKSFYFKDNKFSFSWFKSVLDYVDIDEKYTSFIRPEGIYLEFDPNSDYNIQYANICKNIVNTIEKFYKKGLVVIENIIDSNVRSKLIEDWQLISLDEDNRLFQPIWEDKRFAPNLVDFLTLKISGDPDIQFILPDNLVKRHKIIMEMQKAQIAVIVEGSYLRVNVDNLTEARKVAALFTAAKTTTFGRVLTITASRLSEVYLYFEYADKFKKGEAISYKTNDVKNPYIFSVLLKENNLESTEELRKRFVEYSVKRLIETSQNASKIVKFKNMSPHDIIEQEYSK